MAKIRIGKDFEITLDTKEVLELIREYSTSHPSTTIQKKIEDLAPKQGGLPQPENNMSKIDVVEADLDSIELPSVEVLVKAIEARGRPFTFTLMEEQTRLLGKYYDTKKYPKVYRRFYYIYRDVQELMKTKYGGRWERKTEMTDGHQVMRYTLIEKSNQT